MSEPIEIAIYSDVICPWCLIGAKRLDRALGRLGREVEPILYWLPFELNPGMPPEGMDRQEYAAAKFGGPDRAAEVYARIAHVGAEDGIAFDFAAMPRTPSTFKAHRLIHWANAQDASRGDRLKRALFARHFHGFEDVGTDPVLLAAAEEAGLDLAEAAAVLASDRESQAVRQLEAQARRLGVEGVPVFLFNRRYAVTGAQPPEVLIDAIRAAIKDGPPAAPGGA